MQDRKRVFQSLNDFTDYEFSTYYRPERGLLAGILERAVRDLGYDVERCHQRDAIRWFKGKTKEEYITFKTVAQELDLTAGQVEFILSLVDAVERDCED